MSFSKKTSGSGGTVNPATIDHDLLLHTHNLTTDINHNTIANAHNLTTNINHNTIANAHNLTTNIDHDAITNGHNIAEESFPFGYGDQNTLQINNITYYNRDIIGENMTVKSVLLDVETVSVTPTNIDIGIYNDAGTKIAGIASPQTMQAGINKINLATPLALAAGAIYWLGVAGHDGGQSQFHADNTNSINNAAFNRSDATPTVGASLPAGTGTATRIWARLVNYA